APGPKLAMGSALLAAAGLLLLRGERNRILGMGIGSCNRDGKRFTGLVFLNERAECLNQKRLEARGRVGNLCLQLQSSVQIYMLAYHVKSSMHRCRGAGHPKGQIRERSHTIF